LLNRLFTDLGSEFVSQLSTCGFVYLVNHGVAEGKVSALAKDLRSFFAHPKEVKSEAYPRTADGQGFMDHGENIDDREMV